MARGAAAVRFPPVKYSLTRLGGGQTYNGAVYPGGLDLTTPSLALQPGALRDVINFEVSQSGGYARIAGYERFDGRISPSAASYQIVQVSSFTNVPTAGQVITQATSGATGTIIAVNNVAGVYYMAVTKITGTFDGTHAITTPGPVNVGTAVTAMVSVSSLQNAQYLAAAAAVYRALIGAVPGSGPVRGVVAMAFAGVDNVYAFRDNVGATAVQLYKSSPSGWVLVPFFNTVNFTAGGGATPADGATLTQGGVTATIKRVMTQSGAWTGTAAGTFVITNPAGGNFAAGAATATGGVTVTLSGVQTAITLLPGGHFEFDRGNFSGQLVTRRIYGCDGVNKAFEFDGTTLAPITTGLPVDAPTHLRIHKNILFLSFASSLIYSGAGTPFKYSAIDGGGEIATGDTVTALISLPGAQTTGTLAVYMRNNTAILYGIDPTTFNFVLFNPGTGALPYGVQNLFDTFAFDDSGVVNLKTTLNYGNFVASALTKNIQPFIQQERTKLTASAVSRDKSQYRAFFSDGYGLWLTAVNDNYLGASVVQFPNPVFCCDSGETSNGVEVSYFGSSDGLGFVYQLDTGTSFDGANIEAHITLAWDALKSPRILKRFRAASIEIQGNFYASVMFGYQLGYGTTLIGQPSYVPYATGFAGAPVWDTFVWDNFVWDGQTLTPTDVDMTGTAENVQVTISCGTNYIAAFNVNSVIYHFSDRRGLRV